MLLQISVDVAALHKVNELLQPAHLHLTHLRHVARVVQRLLEVGPRLPLNDQRQHALLVSPGQKKKIPHRHVLFLRLAEPHLAVDGLVPQFIGLSRVDEQRHNVQSA